MKISIITVNLNNRKGLQKTIDSIVSQTYPGFEWIVVDGGSSDGSRELLEQYAGNMSRMVSEPDSGIYEAMNKGVRLASGEYCIFMNSGDYFADKTVLAQTAFFLNDGFDVLTGEEIITKDGEIIGRAIPPENIGAGLLYDKSLSHQSSFIKRSLLLSFPYDESLRFVSDWKWWVEVLLRRRGTYRAIDVAVTIFNHDGLTFSIQRDEAEAEREAVLKQLFPEGRPSSERNPKRPGVSIRAKNKLKRVVLGRRWGRTLAEGAALSMTMGPAGFLVAVCREFGAGGNVFFRRKHHNLVMRHMRKNYAQVLDGCMGEDATPESSVLNPVIWVVWWQGEAMMPLLPKVCLSSLRNNAGGYEVRLVTSENYKEFVDIPQYVLDAMWQGRISLTFFSDILRFALLARHGGLYMDSTLLTTGEIPDISQHGFYTAKMRDTGDCRFISAYRWTSYLVGGKAGQRIFVQMRDLLFEYVRREKQLIDYYLVDYALNLIYETDEQCRAKIDAIPYNNGKILDFESYMNSQYDSVLFMHLTENTVFHKLNRRLRHDVVQPGEGNLTLWGHVICTVPAYCRN